VAKADSKITVSIVGDASKLSGSLDDANKQVGKFSGGIGKVATGIAALGAATVAVDFLKGATQEADRLGDAVTRLNAQLGPTLSADLEKASTGFTNLGASKQDILELEAAFVDAGTAMGQSGSALAGISQQAAILATKLSLVKDQDPSELLSLIAKAGGGASKAAKELGVTLIDGANASTQLNNVLAQLQAKYGDVGEGALDLEQQQKKLDAELETFSATLGGPVSDALAGVVGFINDEIDAIPGAIQGWQMLGAAVEGFGRTALGPLGNVRDALEGLSNLLGDVAFNLTHIGSGAVSERTIRQANDDFNNRQGRGN